MRVETITKPIGIAMNAAQKAKSWIQLDYHDPATVGVTITPADGDLFAMTKEMAIRGCQIGSRLNEFDTQISGVWEVLKEWASEHRQYVDKAFLALKGSGFLFLVIQKEPTYNRVLEDSLTDLDIKIAQNHDFQLIHLSVLAIPDSSEETIRTFLPLQGSMANDHANRDESS